MENLLLSCCMDDDLIEEVIKRAGSQEETCGIFFNQLLSRIFQSNAKLYRDMRDYASDMESIAMFAMANSKGSRSIKAFDVESIIRSKLAAHNFKTFLNAEMWKRFFKEEKAGNDH